MVKSSARPCFGAFFRALGAALLTTLAAPQGLQAEQNKRCTAASETQFELLAEQLTALEQKVQAHRTFWSPAHNHLNERSAQWLWDQAVGYEAAGNTWTALAAYKQYLERTQTLPAKQLQDTYLRLSSLSFRLGLGRDGFVFAKKYLATFVGSAPKNFDTLPSLLRQILASLNTGPLPASELSEFLAVLASLDLPREYEDETAFLSARIALKLGRSQLAKLWLQRLEAPTDFNPLQANALYYRGRYLLQEHQWTQARLALKTALTKLSKKDELYAATQLAYARLHFFLRKKKIAEKHYELIPSDSPLYKDALYERTLLQASQNDWKKARFLSWVFLTDYASDTRAYHLKSLLPYFDLKTHNLAAAEAAIKNQLQKLEALQAYFKHYALHTPYDEQGLPLFQAPQEAQEHLAPPPRLAVLLRTETQLEALAHSLALQEALLQQSLLAFSHSHSAQLQAPLYQQRGQLLDLGTELLATLQKMLLAEACLYQKKLLPTQDQQLKLIETQRQNLRQEKTKQFLALAAEQTPYHYDRRLEALKALGANLQGLTAKNASLAFLSKLGQRNSAPGLLAATQRNKRQLTALEASLATVVGDFNSVYLRSQETQLHAEPDFVLFKKEIQLIHRAVGILAPLRLEQPTASSRLSTRTFNANWAYGLELLTALEADLQTLTTTLTHQTNNLALDLQNYQEQLNQLRSGYESIQAKLRQVAAANLAELLNSYQEQITQTTGRLQKWLGDINWQEYQDLRQLNLHKDAAFEMDKATLDLRLKQLDEGVLQAWY